MLLKDQKISGSERIKDYEIISVKIKETNDTGFQFDVYYPATEDFILAGNGIVEDNGWITGKYYLGYVAQDDNKYTLTQLATGE